MGFEPTRGDPIGLAGRRLNHSAKVSSGTGQCSLKNKTAQLRSGEEPRSTKIRSQQVTTEDPRNQFLQCGCEARPK